LAGVDPSPTSIEPAWIELGLLAILTAAYVRAQRRYPASGGRRVAFGAGVVLAAALFLSPVETLSRHYLLSAHLFQNIALAEWVPLLLAVGLGPDLAQRLGRLPVIRVLTRPYVALPVWILVYAAWHVPISYETALENPGSLLALEHVTYVLAGVLLWWPVLYWERWEGRSGQKALYVFLAFVLSSPIGLVFVLFPEAVYDFYAQALRIEGLSAITDQRIAGILMSLGEAVVFFAAFVVYFTRFLAEEDRRAPP
jgi:cytochrome c oxidase assembly factor CtaG